MLKNCSVAIVLLIATASISAQTVPAIVNPVGSPVQIVSINSTLADFLNSVRIKNVSGKKVASFQLGLIMSVPAGCGPSEVIGNERLMPVSLVSIEPGLTQDAFGYGLVPGDMQLFGEATQAKVVHSQLAVVRVEFGDGSTWALPRSGKTYDDALMARNAFLQCSNTPKAVLARASVR